MSSATSTTLSQLVVLLTRPLISVYPPTKVLTLQLALQANLMTFLPGKEIQSPFTFHLSPLSLPPTPFYAACLTSGVSWPEWIRVLGGEVMYVFVMEGSVKIRFGEHGEGVTVWSEESMKQEIAASTPRDVAKPSVMEPKLRAMLDSVRARAQARNATTEETYDSDAESDSDSDTESTTSSHLSAFSAVSHAESLTSVSSAASSVASSCASLTNNTKSSTSPKVTPASSSTTSVYNPPAKLLSRSQRRLARATVNPAKQTLTKYTYEGGATGVVTGGVMLGATSKPSNCLPSKGSKGQVTRRAVESDRAGTRPQQKRGSKADKVDNWRQPRATGSMRI